MRVAVYCACVLLVFAFYGAAAAKEQAGETFFAFGHELMPLGNLLGETRVLDLNGQRVSISNAVTAESLSQVLDRFQSHCREHVGPTGRLPGLAEGVLREDRDGEGIVLCFARGAEAEGPSFLAALHRFSQSSDLAEFGHLRYVYAKRMPSGQTHVLTAWTEGHFDVSHLAPSGEIDAPGTDSTLAPRPRGARRLLSATIEGSPFGLRVYETRESVDAVHRAFDIELQSAGWTIASRHREAAGDDAIRVYARDATEILVTISGPTSPGHTGDGATVVSIGEMGSS